MKLLFYFTSLLAVALVNSYSVLHSGYLSHWNARTSPTRRPRRSGLNMIQLAGGPPLPQGQGSKPPTPWSIPSSSPSDPSVTPNTELSAKSITKEIMSFFSQAQGPVSDKNRDAAFAARLADPVVRTHVDGVHMITMMFQCARARRRVKTFVPLDYMLEKLGAWDREWSERDISMFVYGIRSLECVESVEGDLLKLAATKISESKSPLTSRAIGNALYGLQDITSDNAGAGEVCRALTIKINDFRGNFNGQDVGIGIYGLQGMSSDKPEVSELIAALATKISQSEVDFDAQALSNALYGLQSMSSEDPAVLALVSALAAKVGESRPMLCAQAIGSALYGLQRLSSDSLEVRTLVATLAEKMESSVEAWDRQAVTSGLFGLQEMKSNSPEVRSLIQAIANKISGLEIQLDSQSIGSALYGLHNLNSDVPQVRALLAALAKLIKFSQCKLSGQAIADALYGLQGMTTDCLELRSLLGALADRIDASEGKLDSQEIGNALFGLQSMTSDMQEIRVIVNKLAEKIKRSKAYLRSQHISRAMLGLQRFSADSSEVRNLLKQLTKRIAESDRTTLPGTAIADSCFGLQGLDSKISEVQELIAELAKKIAVSNALLTPTDIGRAVYGLQGLSSGASIFQESAIGLDSDEVQFLVSALWDKVKLCREPFSLESIGLALQGLMRLKDPIANNMKQFFYKEAVKAQANVPIADGMALNPLHVISVYKGLRLNALPVPKWIEDRYQRIVTANAIEPVVELSRADKIITTKYLTLHPGASNVEFNTFLDGFRVDMLWRDANLIIELDGPRHLYPARKRYDAERDAFLLKAGYQTKRLSTTGQSFDDVVKQIDSIVTVALERKAESDVQRLYASEEALQKQYKKK